MVTTVQPDLVHIVILDISGVYVLDSILGEYNDESHWRVVAFD